MNDKEQLFELFRKINPDFKGTVLNEAVNPITPVAGQTTPQQSNTPSDVASVQRAAKSASGLGIANKRINTATEFSEAFKNWFSSLGYKPDNPAISSMKVITDVKKAMQELGFH